MEVQKVFGNNNSSAVSNATNVVANKKNSSIFGDINKKPDLAKLLAENPDGHIVNINGRSYFHYTDGPRDDKGRACPTEYYTGIEVYIDLETGAVHRTGFGADRIFGKLKKPEDEKPMDPIIKWIIEDFERKVRSGELVPVPDRFGRIHYMPPGTIID